MKLGVKLLMLGAALLALPAACEYPTFQFAGGNSTPTGSGGATGGTSSGGSNPGGSGGGHGGAAGSLPPGGSTPDGGGLGGSGGTDVVPCELWGPPVCGPGEKCSVIDEYTGETACVTAGTQETWGRCEFDIECRDRQWCDHTRGLCKPICQTRNDCDDNAECIEALRVDQGVIPELRVCTSYCHPTEGAPCHFDRVTCVYDLSHGWDCAASGGLAYGAACGASADCLLGMLCHDFIGKSCRRWCTNLGECCAWLGICLAWCEQLAEQPRHEGIEYGVCWGVL